MPMANRYVYWRETKDAAHIAKVLTEDEARRIASNIAKLPALRLCHSLPVERVGQRLSFIRR